jgi:sugar phosphate isomerase/epimerase
MQLGIFAKTFAGHTPTDVLAAAEAAGYDCVQYNWACSGLDSMPDEVPQAALEATQAAISSSGLEAVALSGTFNMIHPDTEVRQHGLARLETVIASASALNIPMVTLCTGSRNPHDQWAAHPDNDTDLAWNDLMLIMAEAVRMAERHDVCLGVEPELANTVNSIDKASRLMQAFSSSHLRIVLDPANLFEQVSNAERHAIIERAIDELAPYISLCHAKDRLADGQFCVAGDGVIDYPHYLSCLKRIGYAGPMITHGLEADDAPRVAAFLTASITAVS